MNERRYNMESSGVVRINDRNDQNPAQYSYSIMPQIRNSIEIGTYRTYGIQVKGWGYTQIIGDVSSQRDVVERMVEIFNRERLSPLHLCEVIEDILGS